MNKPAMLQINTSGAWRNVVPFDVADENSTNLIMEAAATLAAHGDGEPTVRIVSRKDGYAEPLMCWERKSGRWEPWRSPGE